jgi:hypothetical protein
VGEHVLEHAQVQAVVRSSILQMLQNKTNKKNERNNKNDCKILLGAMS